MPLIHRRTSHDDADSIDETQPQSADQKKPKSRRPPNTAFRQQRLKAWQPILTPKTVLPLFFTIGIIFAPIGALLLYASFRVQELTIDYTHCATEASSTLSEIPTKYVQAHFKSVNLKSHPAQWLIYTNSSAPDGQQDVCRLRFRIEHDMTPPILAYYKLTNFYQNHRRYVQSIDEDQINGKAVPANKLRSDNLCKPLVLNPEGKPYYPCGLIANSYFNDTFASPVFKGDIEVHNADADNVPFNMTQTGIAWSNDKKRFQKTAYKASEVVPPPNWQASFPDGYTDDNLPDISEWESLQNWMRTAGLPTFSKLVLRNDTQSLSKGVYEIDIGLHFPVTVYGGTKSLVISTRSVVGGRNNFLGIAYLVVGGLCIVLGLLFTVRHLIKPRKLGDHTYLSWNNENSLSSSAPLAGTATR
ncbi:ligand-effect modulator 3 family [Lipomyces japonicus]|uniref:ligand-effect modulator 3 family n=1 Tax=Lipomyces japonicus TaxID=56871 RepID=UPI0034D00260